MPHILRVKNEVLWRAVIDTELALSVGQRVLPWFCQMERTGEDGVSKSLIRTKVSGENCVIFYIDEWIV